MSKSEVEIERLISIEQPDNPIRVVVNVMELTEGWDVTNVYVVTPLRAMATFTGALQAMGRGLRLPAGRRVGKPILDELDVVCFGREKLQRIVSEAIEWTGTADPKIGGVKVTSSDQADPEIVSVNVRALKDVSVKCADLRIERQELNTSLSPDALRSVSEAIVTEVDLVAALTRLGVGRPRIARDRFCRVAALRCIRELPEFLSDDLHTEAIERIVHAWLATTQPGDGPVTYDPAEVGEQIAAALRRNATLAAPQYKERQQGRTFSFPDYVGRQEVMLAPGAVAPTRTVADLPAFEVGNFIKGQLYRGWKKGIHEAYAFDSEPEALVAALLDQSSDVEWWIRNSPVRIEIETPAGRYRPDFLVKLVDGRSKAYIILEAKADHRWEDRYSEERLKNRAAQEWAEQQRKLGFDVVIGVALETDIRRSASWAELEARLC